MDRNQLLAVTAAISVLSSENKKNNRSRSIWTKQWLLKRKTYSHVNLLNELKVHPADWFNYLRMDEQTYLDLLQLVTPYIQKKNTQLREAISPHERLTVTLRYLATGRTYEDLKFSAIISPQCIGKIIPETCDALYKVLRNSYLKFPQSELEWREIATEFEEKWNFPNCLGSVDGKHVQITAPPNSGSFYYNYKQTYSLVLMAITNANYEFIMVDFGTNGRVSDGGVIENTEVYRKLINNELKIPQPSRPRNSDKLLPYVFIGDEAFSLRNDFLKPFSQKELDREKRLFNYRLSRARRTVENTFGIMAARFRIFLQVINLKLENIEKVVMAACVLHNYLRKIRGDNYYSPQHDSAEAEGFLSLQKGHNRHASDAAKAVRELYKTYFCNEGAVPWQKDRI